MPTSRIAGIALLALAAGVAGCGGDDGPQMLWDPGGGFLWAFPDDAFTIDAADSRTGLRVDLGPDRVPELQTVPETFQEIFVTLRRLDGFGLTAGVVLRFNVPLDPGALVSGPDSVDPAAPVALMVETGAGLVAWPYEAHLSDEDETLILEPMVPLPPASRGFVAVTRRLATADGRELLPSPAMRAALAGDGVDAVSARVAPRMAAAAAAYVDAGGVADLGELAGVVVFTTQSAYEDTLAIAADVRGRPVTADPDIECVEEALWIRCVGSFEAVDYRGADGIIDEVGADGPEPGGTYTLPFSVWLPLERPGPYGGDAFPVIVFGHGLGGEREQAERLAEFAAPRGLATIAIDAVRHGRHPTAMSQATLTRILDFFAISSRELSFEPMKMREHFRQSTFDTLQLLELLAGGLDLDGDEVVDLDPARLMYLGVSLGGIMGPALLSLAPEIGAAVLVVPGGRVASIVSDAEQFALLVELMKPEGTTDGDVDRFFPIIQTTIDRGDAAVWAVHLLAPPSERPAGMPAAAPHVLMGMVLDDDTVPNTSNRALARALGVPVVPPLRQEVGLVGMTAEAPVAANLGDGRTAGLLQLDRVGDGAGGLRPATHSNVGASDVGVEAWLRFLDAYLVEGVPVIVDPYVELGY
jgi:dienelactone hydrolase